MVIYHLVTEMIEWIPFIPQKSTFLLKSYTKLKLRKKMSLRRPRFKIVLIGDTKTGKRKLLERYINGSFDFEMSTEFYQSAFKKGNVTTSVSHI